MFHRYIMCDFSIDSKDNVLNDKHYKRPANVLNDKHYKRPAKLVSSPSFPSV